MRVNSNSLYNSLNWLNLYDADAFFQFRGQIQIIEVISIPNHFRDTLTSITLNTLHSWKGFVRVNSFCRITNLIGHIFMMQMHCFHFRVLIQILKVISIPNHSRDSLTLIKLNTLHTWKWCVRVNSNLWYNWLNLLNLYDADAFFPFRVLIQILEVISNPNHSRDSLTLIKLNTLHTWKGCVRVNSNLWYNWLNFLIFMMQMLSFNFGIWFTF